MAKTAHVRRSRRGLLTGVGVVTAAAVLVGFAVFADGFDAQEMPPLETSVWVARDAGQYARVNTDLAEIDTVRQVDDPTAVAQSGAHSVVFSQGYRQLWLVSPSNPIDLIAASAPTTEAAAEGDAAPDSPEPAGAGNTPLGTRSVSSSGDRLVYLTDTGAVFVSSVSGTAGDAPEASPVNPFATAEVAEGAEPQSYSADAAAIDDDGQVVMFSAEEAAVRRFDANTSEFVGGSVAVTDPPDSDARLELAIVGGTWVLSSPADGLVWIDGVAGSIDLGLSGEARLQASSSDGSVAYLADASSLISLDLTTGEFTEVAEGAGVPAAPVNVDGLIYAAWLSNAAGTLWSSATGTVVPLQVDGDELEQVQAIRPVIQSNGQRAVLNEQTSGMVWTIPDGTLIPLSQWSIDDEDETAGTVQVDDVSQQEPPVAVTDSFGVRRGALVSLPLLLNDHDPNKKDVLTIVANSVSSSLAQPAFGDLSLVSNNQSAAIFVRARSGSTTFTYTVTDGAATSAPATVTLRVIPDATNTPPVWCGVRECQQVWPTPQIAPGGTVKVPVLAAWVDPEGDALVLTDAVKTDLDAPVSVVATADGSVAIRHNDPNASDETISITVTVSDSQGARTEKELVLSVSSNPALVAAPVAVMAGVKEKTSISVADHVSGGSGAYRVLDAVETSTATGGLVVVPNAAAGTIELTAEKPGEYLVNYSVLDSGTLAEQSALVRMTVVDSDTPLTMAPISAFVRANEDTTIDVIGAVQNTTGRVLIVTQANSSSPDLGVSVVGQSRLRVSGTTGNGEPGLVGTATVRISDGASAVVEGQVSVFLVPSTTRTTPIAVPDAVTVRAGAQVDIPVLENDFSPRGERLVVHPEVQGSGTAGEIAFAGERVVRYLAPTAPGTYRITYTTYLEGQPDRIDRAPVIITVLPPGSNRAPQPPILTARAIAGQTVLIPVDGYGMDPDGDSVVLAAVEPPSNSRGVANISADGSSILYAAPAGGIATGQATFSYTVRDSDGAEARGLVRVGVVSNELSDVTPVTYSDYVRVQLDSPAPVTVMPMADDRDPAQGVLSLIDLVPNAKAGTTEYTRLEQLIDSSTTLDDGTVVLQPGTVLGTHSYVYTVESSVSTSTAQGLIVVDVTDGAAPDAPIVRDTVVTAKDRSTLATGIDVVTGKVQWATGDVAGLTLEIWGSASSDFTVTGSSIAGSLPKKGALVPFSLTGKDSAGTKVTTYGFMRIPAFDDMRVQVRASVDGVEVGEEKSVEFAVRKLLDLDSADSVQYRDDATYAVQRANASCLPAGSGRARYDAGREAPWVDSCTVPVRLEGQREWTLVSIPVSIQPKDPQAILNSITRTLPAGGRAETVDLYANVTSWEGGRVGDVDRLDYETVYKGASFIVTRTGTTLSAEARANARPGTRETVAVSVSSYGGLTAGVTFIVGLAANDAPRGAEFTQSCTVKTACTISVVDRAGEYDPFAGKADGGLTLVSVGNGSAVNCPIASARLGNTKQIVVSWPSAPRPAGGTCVIPFTVQDAQKRSGTGTLTLDVQGFPQIPSSVFTTDYSATSVTLDVPLGEAQQAHPEITGVAIYEAGSKVSANCARGGPGAYRCVVSGLENGIHHTYTARAVNVVGESLDTTPHTTWSYRSPVITSLTAEPAYDPDRTTQNAGVVDLTIVSADDTLRFMIVNTNETVDRVSATTTRSITLAPGAREVQVIPVSQYSPPIGDPSSDGAVKRANVTVAGSPSFTANGTVSTTGSSVTLSGVSFASNSSLVPSSVIYLLWKAGEPTCVMLPGAVAGASGGDPNTAHSASPTFSGLDNYTEYRVKACGTNGYGAASTAAKDAGTYSVPGAPTGTLTYTILATPAGAATNAAVRQFTLTAGPIVDPKAEHTTKFYKNGGSATTDFASLVQPGDSAGTITVKYCKTVYFERCSPAATVVGNAATAVTVTFPSDACVADPQGNDVTVSGGASGFASRSASDDGTTVTYTVTWSGPYANLDNQTYTIPLCAVVPPDDGGGG
ncbi:MAG: Ig-like domain-containing protein [Microbacteriaceae bacterium]